MELFHNNKNEKDFSTIFSTITDTERTNEIFKLQDDLSKLQQNVYLLSFYGSKGKINTKKIRKNLFPNNFLTEPNKRLKASKKDLKSIDYNSNKFRNSINSVTKPKNKDKKTINTIATDINKNSINKMAKTSFPNKGSESSIFMTNINYKNQSREDTSNNLHILNTLNNTGYSISLNNKDFFSKNKADNLPKLKRVNFSPISSSNENDASFTKIKIGKKNMTQRNIPLFNSKNKSITLDKEQFPKVTNNLIKSMKKENNDIKNRIYKGKEKFNLMEWYMKTRFKYAQYKFGIAEIQKYFMDLRAYGKPEEEEIEKRKTFYEHVEDIIDDIHVTQQKKEIEKLNRKYGVKYDKKKLYKKKDEGKENKAEIQKKQMMELSKELQLIDKRRKNEKKKRQEIDDILFKSKQRVQAINSMDRKLPKNKRIDINFL